MYRFLSSLFGSTKSSSSINPRRRPALALECLEGRIAPAVIPVGPSQAIKTIQAGVNAASPGDQVQVDNGTYNEQVFINKSITVMATPGQTPIIQAPSGTLASRFTQTAGANPDDTTPVVLVFGSASVQVTVQGFTIQGPFTKQVANIAGIEVSDGATATIVSDTITGINDGTTDKIGVGILVGQQGTSATSATISTTGIATISSTTVTGSGNVDISVQDTSKPYNVTFGTSALTLDAGSQPVGTGTGTLVLASRQATLQYTPVSSINLNNASSIQAFAGPDTADRASGFIGLSTTEHFIQALYLDEVGRAGTKTELDGWLPVFNGSGGAGAVAAGIKGSQEAHDHQVKSWYLTYLGRQASGGEEQGFVNELLAGQTEEQVLSQILGSSEFVSHAQTLVTTGTVQQRFAQALYQLLLNRSASPGELSNAIVAIGRLGQQGFALSILQSQEFRTYQVEGYYNALLHRPSDSTGLNGFVSSAEDMSSVRASIEGTSEFFNKG
jgi:hypothetical protein